MMNAILNFFSVSTAAFFWAACFWAAFCTADLHADDLKEAQPAQVSAETNSAEQVSVSWQLDGYPADGQPGHQVTYTVANRGTTNLKSNWTLYFNRMPRIITRSSVRGDLNVETISGNFCKIFPVDSAKAIPAGGKGSVTFTGQWALAKNCEAPSGGYLVFQNDDGTASQPVAVDIDAKPIAVQQQRDFGYGDLIVTAAQRFAENEKIAAARLPDCPIIPTPRVYRANDKSFLLAPTTKIAFTSESKSAAEPIQAAIKRVFGKVDLKQSASVSEIPVPKTNLKYDSNATPAKGISLVVDSNAASESYTLDIDESGVRIVGDAAGVFYGACSLALLIDEARTVAEDDGQNDGEIEQMMLPGVHVEDAPRFGYRGWHLDVARNFHSKASVLMLLDQMALYKLNKFHLHCVDDEGWRIEIAGLPELTDVGARRGHTTDESTCLYPAYGSGPDADTPTNFGSGFYSRADFKEILRFAASRHIEVIPEIDLPGHARAAIVAMKARYHRLAAEGKIEQAEEFLLSDLDDKSEYRSIQGYTDNVVCVCHPGTTRFVKKVVEELKTLYQECDLQLKTVHVGGDEVPGGVWEKSPICQSYLKQPGGPEETSELQTDFFQRMVALFETLDVKLAGWEEVVLKSDSENGGHSVLNPAFAAGQFDAYVWNSVVGSGTEGVGYSLANNGVPCVLCNASNLYVSLSPAMDPDVLGSTLAGLPNEKTVYEFCPLNIYKTFRNDKNGRPVDRGAFYADMPRLTDAGRANILGIQGHIWSEFIVGPRRLEERVFPRFISLAERAWAPMPEWVSIEGYEALDAELEKSYLPFMKLIGRGPRNRWDSAGIRWRIAKPGAVIEDGKLKANTTYDRLTIRYTNDGTTPTVDSPEWKSPVEVDVEKPVKVRAFGANGNQSLVTIVGE